PTTFDCCPWNQMSSAATSAFNKAYNCSASEVRSVASTEPRTQNAKPARTTAAAKGQIQSCLRRNKFVAESDRPDAHLLFTTTSSARQPVEEKRNQAT